MKKPKPPELVEVVATVAVDCGHGTLVEILKWSTDQLDTFRWTVRTLDRYARTLPDSSRRWLDYGPFVSSAAAADCAGGHCHQVARSDGLPGVMLNRGPIRSAA